MTDHTPGPWDYRKGLGCKDIGPRLSRQSIQGIASTWGLSDDKEDEANARLIAAAPDLLDAADRALVTLDALYHQPELCRRLRAAIAKARGKHD